jgi:signal transduction histidine kinase
MVGGVGLVGIGGGLTLSYAIVVVFFQNPLVLGVIVPALMAVTVVAVALWLWRRGPEDERLYQLGVWCSTVTLFAAALGMVNIYSEWMVGGQVKSGVIMVANSASLGAVLGLIIGYYDLDREREHRQVQAKQAEIESLNERLTVLNRVLRHDIRNDVNLVEGYVDMADTDRLTDRDAHDMIREKTREIVDLSARARRVEELLYEDDSTTQSVDLVGMVRTEILHLQDGHPDDVIVDADLPDEATVVGNDLLQSVVDNLLENAVEHADTSPIRIEITIRSVDGGYDLVVADNGPGLPEQEQRVITDGEETDLRHSSGMGLWLVTWIVPEFGGTIQMENGEAGGTEITIWLPEPGNEASVETDETTNVGRPSEPAIKASSETIISRFTAGAQFPGLFGLDRK